MSNLLYRLQARLKAALYTKLHFEKSSKSAPPRIDSLFYKLRDRLKNYTYLASHFKSQLGINAVRPLLSIRSNASFNPNSAAKSLSYLFMIAFASTFTYWAMQIAQIASPPFFSSTLTTPKGMILYTNQDNMSAYGLFGSKPLLSDAIFLRGVVATSKGTDGRLDGFAIFEIDGKQTNAIGVGESFGKGLTLHSIGDESATLLYEGRQIDFKLKNASASKR